MFLQKVLDTFSRCIIRSPEEVDFNELLCVQVVAFMMDNYTDLMDVPSDLKARIEDRIIQLRRTKVKKGFIHVFSVIVSKLIQIVTSMDRS